MRREPRSWYIEDSNISILLMIKNCVSITAGKITSNRGIRNILYSWLKKNPARPAPQSPSNEMKSNIEAKKSLSQYTKITPRASFKCGCAWTLSLRRAMPIITCAMADDTELTARIYACKSKFQLSSNCVEIKVQPSEPHRNQGKQKRAHEKTTVVYDKFRQLNFDSSLFAAVRENSFRCMNI